jgi:hydrogenase nickel incorporation protein HypA/HybF
MHEYSLVRALLERVDAEVQRREATAVYRIRVRLGELSGVDPELFERAFEMARIPTASAAAELEVIRVPAVWGCPGCRAPIARGVALQCKECEMPARLVEGDDLVLERIEMEVD